MLMLVGCAEYPCIQGRNHGIDIGGGPNVSPSPDIFF